MSEFDFDLDEFKQLLIKKRDALQYVADSGEHAARTVELDQARVGRLSRMDALQGQAMAKESERRRQLEAQRISGALQRIDSGEYGYCLRCGEPIAQRRLRVDPAATLCVDCASSAEG